MKARDPRILDIQKASRIRVSQGIPHRNEGQDGDLAVSDYRSEVKLYIKYKGAWHGVSMGKAFDKIKDKAENSISKEDNRRDRMLVATNKIISDDDFTLDGSADIILDADGGEIYFKDGGTTFGSVSTAGSFSSLTLYEDGGASDDDYFLIRTGAHGATDIRTIDGSGSAGADIILDPNGDLKVSGADVKIDATKSLYFDGGGDTRIFQSTADNLRFTVGNAVLLHLAEDATVSAAQSSGILTGCPIKLKDLGGVADTPASGYGSLYVNSDELFFKTDAGRIMPLKTGWHGSTTKIKFFPHQFVAHEGTSARQDMLIEDDVAGKLGGRVSHTSAVMYSWISIPTGYTATVVRCYADTGSNLDVQCWSTDIDDGDITDIGNGNASAEVNITDVASTSTNSIIVMLTFANTTTEFYGGYITITES